jgi:hypothetical protein
MDNWIIKVEPDQTDTMENTGFELAENTMKSDSIDEDRMFEFEKVLIKMEPEDYGTENVEDGNILATSVEIHPVKLEDKEEQSNMLCNGSFRLTPRHLRTTKLLGLSRSLDRI